MIALGNELMRVQFTILAQIILLFLYGISAFSSVEKNCELLEGVYKISDLSIDNEIQNLVDYESFLTVFALESSDSLSVSLVSSNRGGDYKSKMYTKSTYRIQESRFPEKDQSIVDQLFVYTQTLCEETGFTIHTNYVPFYNSQDPALTSIRKVTRIIKQFDESTLLLTVVSDNSQIESVYKKVELNELSYLKVLKIIELQSQNSTSPLLN